MKKSRTLLSRILWKFSSFLLSAIILCGFIYLCLEIQLPNVDTLKDMQLQVPLRVYSHEGKLIGEYGEMRRSPIPLSRIPKQLINAVLATEDQRFFEHGGVDIFGLMRATVKLAATGTKSEGGSTITMQVARNFYLTSKKTFMRKINEILLAIKIDKELSKQKILELYLNKIYFGNRAYGVAAAAQVYYGKSLDQLTLAELAMIAGLPKAPSAINPIANPVAAKQRRNHVLSRMLEHGYIDNKAYKVAINAPVAASYHGQTVELDAPYVGEMVRDAIIKQYGDTTYKNGYKVFTTLDTKLQTAAANALRTGLLAYDQRHGFRKLKNLGQPAGNSLTAWKNALAKIPTLNSLKPAVVIKTNADNITALLANGQTINVPWDSFNWSQVQLKDRSWILRPASPELLFKAGDLIRAYHASSGSWSIAQVPQAEAAFVSLNPQTGAITSLIGGFDYLKSNFNRVLQAERQPGSGFKPFIYAAALDNGYTLASIINDAPIVYSDQAGSMWRPQNNERKFYGPTRLRVALAKSRNLVSIRILEDIGIPYALDYISRFGFDPNKQPKELSLALGTGSATPLEVAAGFAIFANGGYKVAPYLIDRIENAQGQTIYQAHPKTACPNCSATPSDAYATQAISTQTAFLITSALQDVIQHGTGYAASVLNRSDLAGKTGTTNDQVDAWFSGFNSNIVATAWMGFDQPYPLKEYGAQAALPIWINFMKVALQNQPEHTLPQPPGIVSVPIDPNTGLLARTDQEDSLFEFFKTGTIPLQQAPVADQPFAETVPDNEEDPGQPQEPAAEPLF